MTIPPVWLAFWVGTIIGGVVTLAIMSLCVVAGRADDDMERMMKCRCDDSNQGRNCHDCDHKRFVEAG